MATSNSFVEAYNKLTKLEDELEKMWWQGFDEDLGNLVGDISELRSRWRKTILQRKNAKR